MTHSQNGVTLIELMITVAIIGILAGIAIPGYQEHVRKTRRADAKAALLGLSNAMERRFTETNSFCDAAGGGTAVTDCGTSTGDTGTPSIFTIPTATASFYTITISGISSSSFTLSAAPIGAQSSDKCGTLSLDSTGQKTVALNTLDADTCWNR